MKLNEIDWKDTKRLWKRRVRRVYRNKWFKSFFETLFIFVIVSAFFWKFGITGLIYRATVDEVPDCTGIEHYVNISGDSEFYADYRVMKYDYKNNYDNDKGKYKGIKTPEDLYKRHPYFDCEDMSNAVICLAQHYDIECKRQAGEFYGQEGKQYHIGVECFYEGEWEIYN